MSDSSPPVRHIVSLSGGKDSTALAIYPRDRIPELEYVFCGRGEELPETLLLLLGGLSILLGYQPTIGAILIVIFLVPVAFMMHNFWAIEDPQMKMVEMVNFMKNLALAASALMFLAIPQPWPFSLGG
jgi:uncharacterized membrane protein YphA (DoxX/SURF4 family)